MGDCSHDFFLQLTENDLKNICDLHEATYNILNMFITKS